VPRSAPGVVPGMFWCGTQLAKSVDVAGAVCAVFDLPCPELGLDASCLQVEGGLRCVRRGWSGGGGGDAAYF
jgi:hypothetical protein